ncbi:MAG: DUF1643 domain-containing protein [Anaerolineae bacterium]|nr:DUF1643 domain-containing protein [Anaerolineae bacterium]
MERGAVFDATSQYRYHLWRAWDAGLPRVAFILLNPALADATADDPTLRRCLGFARAWGYGRLDVVNLFAYRTPSPAVLRRARDPVGPDNDATLVEVTRPADLVVVGWGNGGRWLGRDVAVRRLLARLPLTCLGLTKLGQPRHPLYVRSTSILTELTEFAECTEDRYK